MNFHNPRDDNQATGGPLVPAAATVPTAHDPYRSYGGYKDIGSDQGGFDLRHCLHVLIKRKWLILSITATFVVLGAVRTLMQTPLYSATTRLQIDRNVAKVLGEKGRVTDSEGDGESDFLRTHYELIQSRAMAERVASALKLGNDSDFFRSGFSIRGAIGGLFKSHSSGESVVPDQASLERAAAGTIAGRLVVRPVTGSRLVDITYSDPVPSRAQRVAAAYGEAFIAFNLDKRFQATTHAKVFLEDQVSQLQLRVKESEKKLLEFAEREKIVIVSEKASIAETNLASANTALGVLISERVKNEQLWRQIEASDAINLPQLLTNSVIDGLRGRRNTLAIEYKEKLETFKPSYPAMVQISSKVKELDRQLAAEVRVLRASYKAAYESSRAQETEMKERIEILRKEVLDLQQHMIHYNALKRDADINRELYVSLLQRLKEVDVAGGSGSNNVFVVEKPGLPGAPSSPVMFRALQWAFALGFAVSLAGAFLLEHFDDTIRSPEELERSSGLPTLGIIPRIGEETEVLQVLADPRSALSEAYRSLCTALQFSTDSGLPKSLVITSAAPGEGKSLTSLAIARHFATVGLQVLLVDADLRNPSMHVKLGLSNAVGLSNYLTGSVEPGKTLQATDNPNLSFIASGPLPPNAADLLASPRVFSLLTVGLEVFDFIVLDGPPVLGLADAALLSNAAAATIFVVAAGQARTGVVRGALRRLQLSRGGVIGATLTKFDAAKAAGYGYGYGYGYGADTYSYGQSKESSGRQAKLTDAHQSG